MDLVTLSLKKAPADQQMLSMNDQLRITNVRTIRQPAAQVLGNCICKPLHIANFSTN